MYGGVGGAKAAAPSPYPIKESLCHKNLSPDSFTKPEVKDKCGRSKSLRTLIDSERYSEIQYGIKLIGGNLGFSDNIYTFPYFCSFLLKKYLKVKGWDKIHDSQTIANTLKNPLNLEFWIQGVLVPVGQYAGWHKIE